METVAQLEVFDLAGLKIRLSGAPPLLVDAVSKAFSLSKKNAQTYDVAMSGSFAEDEAYAAGMPAFVREKYAEIPPGSPPLLFWGPENEMVVLDKGKETSSYAYCRAPYECFELIAQKLSYKSAPMIFQTVLIPIIAELLLRRNKLLMHAACVSSPEGQGLLFLGDSGDGKTTTAYTMVMQGFGLLSDDMVIACKTGAGIDFVAVREKLNLTAETIAFFPELSRRLPARFDSGMHKMPVDPKTLFADDQLVDSVRPALLFILRKRKGGPKILPAGAKQIFDAVLKGCTFARSETISPQRVGLIWDILDQAKPFELITGLDPQALGRHLAERMRGGWKGPPDQTESTLRGDSAPAPARPMAPSPSHPRLHLLKTMLAHTLDGKPSDRKDTETLLAAAGHPSLAQWARYHRIDAILMKWVVDQEADHRKASYRQARAESVKNAARSLDLFAWAQTIADRLSRGGISPMLLRGPAMAAKYFPDPQLRHYRDLDFIIQPQELEAAEKILGDLGFRLLGDRKYWLKKKELRFGNGRVDVELHWELYRELSSRKCFQAPDYHRDSGRFAINGTPVKVLSSSHLMFSSCLHFALEHKSDRLVRLIDLRQLSRHRGDPVNWPFIVRQAQASGTKMAVGHTLVLAKELLDAEIPEGVLKELAAEGLWEKTAGRLLAPGIFLSHGFFPGLRKSLYGRMV